MNHSDPLPLQIALPHEVMLALGQWLRLVRQRQELTQPMLASKSGVPVTTLSRLERTGEGSIDSLMRALHALGELDRMNEYIDEQHRRASLPRDISEIQPLAAQRKRVRIRKAGNKK